MSSFKFLILTCIVQVDIVIAVFFAMACYYSVAYDGDIQSADPVAAVNLKAYACS